MAPNISANLESEIDYYLFDEGSLAAALGFIAAVEEALQRLGKHPAMGSPCHAYVLDLPGLRSWPLYRYPHLVFYVDRDAYVEIWRVINGVQRCSGVAAQRKWVTFAPLALHCRISTFTPHPLFNSPGSLRIAC
jgi:toxin ParE1/3/4